MRLPVVLAAVLLGCAVLAGPASARWYGSTLTGPANATYGCEAALVNGPVGGQVLSPSNQTTCTYRHGGYLFGNRPTFVVPSSGRVTAIRVKSGPNPAPLRLTVLTGSSRVDTLTGRDIPGTYTCCTARFIGPVFRPKPNAITTKRVNVRVRVTYSRQLQVRIHASDGLALSAVGPGTVPLSIGPALGGFDAGTPLLTGYWPMTATGEPRVEGYSMTGIDLLFAWNFRRR